MAVTPTYNIVFLDKLVTSGLRPMQPWIVQLADYTALFNDRIFADTTNNPITITLPINPNQGETVVISDNNGNFAVNSLTISGNGNMIMGSAQNMIITTADQTISLVYNGNDWRSV
ncbi:MAG: hypothetical protein R8M45_10710 [Ghiorsea sp.]